MDPLAPVPTYPLAYPIAPATTSTPGTVSPVGVSTLPAADQLILANASQYAALSTGVYAFSGVLTSPTTDPQLAASMASDAAANAALGFTQPAATPASPAASSSPVSVGDQLALATASADSQLESALLGGLSGITAGSTTSTVDSLFGVSNTFSLLDTAPTALAYTSPSTASVGTSLNAVA